MQSRTSFATVSYSTHPWCALLHGNTRVLIYHVWHASDAPSVPNECQYVQISLSRSSLPQSSVLQDTRRACSDIRGDWLQAFEQGGGGKKAEAMRALAEAKAKAKAAARAGNGQPAAEDSSASRDGPDPRYPS